MALRHIIPEFKLRPVADRVEPDKVPFIPKPPVTVGFRTGADLRHVVAAVQENKITAIDAAVGSGKTVRVPAELVRATSMLVIHCFPSQLLAYDQHAYVSQNVSVDTCFIEDCQQEFPNRGIVFVSNANLVGRLLSTGRISRDPVILYMDEVHESDAYTYVLKTLASSLPEVKSLVFATATMAMDGSRRRETAGSVQDFTFPESEVPQRWDVFETGRPWSISTFTGNSLLFVESKEEAQRLANDYEDGGLDAYVLTSRMSISLFADCMRKMRDPSHHIVVAVADYSFRSGFTFPVDTLVDSGTVAYVVNDSGIPSKRLRNAFQLERYQAQGRAGRAKGMKAKCFSPKTIPSLAICDLEGVELDAAVVIFRLLGFKPPRELWGSPMMKADVPQDLCEVLQGYQSFGCLPSSILVPLTSLSDKQSSAFDPGIDASRRQGFVRPYDETVSPHDSISYVNVESLSGKHSNEKSDTSADTTVSDKDSRTVFGQSGRQDMLNSEFKSTLDTLWEGMPNLRQLAALSVDDKFMQVGCYYASPDLLHAPQTSTRFPDGMESVKRLVTSADAKYRMRTLSEPDRLYALAALLSAYNIATAEFLALRRIATDTPSAHVNTSVAKDVLRDWAVGVMEVLSDKLSDMRICSKAISAIDSFGLEEMPPMVELELRFAQAHMSHLSDALVDVPTGYKQDYSSLLLSSETASRALLGVVGGLAGRNVDDQYNSSRAYNKMRKCIEPDVKGGSSRAIEPRPSYSRRSSSKRSEYVVRPSEGTNTLWASLVKRVVASGALTLEPKPRRRSSRSYYGDG